MSKVYFISSSSTNHKSDVDRQVKTLFREAGLGRAFERGDLAAIKVHLGEPGCVTAMPPMVVKPFVRAVMKVGAKPFITDTAVLYKSPRDNGVDHACVAQNRGFGFNKVGGAPFIPADGIVGADEIEMPLEDGRHYKKVSVAAGIMHARSMLVLSHATGHLATGLGGTLKNLGMGCVSKKAKLSQHFGQLPGVDAHRCVACGQCAKWCPKEAITVEQAASIDHHECIGCGECIAVCLKGAITFDWSVMGTELQERIVEHAAAVVRSKSGRVCYGTVAWNITKDCDCMGTKQKPVVGDLGLFASFDPVAIDRAVADGIKAKAGQSLESLSYPQTNSEIQLEYAEQMGLGFNHYELVDVSARAARTDEE